MARTDIRGFTLIEVLVALAIAAVGLGLLVAATGSGLRNATVADQYIRATAQAQSRLALVGPVIPLRRGDYSGVEAGGVHWRVQIASPLSRAGVGLYPVTVTESWSPGQSKVSLYSERIGPP